MPTLSERAQELQKKIVSRSVSILTLDIETSPNLGFAFDVWEVNLTPDKIIERSRVLMVGAKWYGAAKVHMLSERTLSHEEMVQQSWDLVDRADIVVGYNQVRFDMRHLKREWLEAGLPPPRPYKNVDLMRVVKRQFSYGSNKLDNVSQVLGIGQKVKHEGFPLWRACLAGDKGAFLRMERYCAGDVRLTERLYDRLRPWIDNHPALGASDEPRCSRCGSARLEGTGDYRAVLLSYKMTRCLDCGAQMRASHPKRIASVRGVG